MQGEWKPKQIDNPKYKGEWVHPEIDNPDYKEDSNLYLFEDNAYVGFDLWQVKAGTIFDNILVTDDVDYAKKFGDDTWGQTKGPETKAKEEVSYWYRRHLLYISTNIRFMSRFFGHNTYIYVYLIDRN